MMENNNTFKEDLNILKVIELMKITEELGDVASRMSYAIITGQLKENLCDDYGVAIRKFAAWQKENVK